MCCGECTIRTTEDCIGLAITDNGETYKRSFRKFEEFTGFIGETVDGFIELMLDNGDSVRLFEGQVEWRC